MMRIFCYFGRHKWSHYWSKAYNLQTGRIRLYHECRRCGEEKPDDYI